jgi:hypothetical protein
MAEKGAFMTKDIRVPLSELTRLRMVCRSCSAALEFSIKDEHANIRDRWSRHVCDQTLRPGRAPEDMDYLHDFLRSLAQLLGSKAVSVELVLPG